MNQEEEITQLKVRVQLLEEKLSCLGDLFMKEGDNTTEHFGKVHALIGELIDYVMPVVHKVFPGIDEGKKEIEAFLKQRPHAGGATKKN
jgi:hypothetical protein